MPVSQKSKDALRAIFQLARGKEPYRIKIPDIAEVQVIPQRFLEMMLSQLKEAAFVTSHRGNEGGYMLEHSQEDLTVAELMEFVQSRVGQIPRRTDKSKAEKHSFRANRVLSGTCGKKIHDAISNWYNGITFSDSEKKKKEQVQPCIIG